MLGYPTIYRKAFFVNPGEGLWMQGKRAQANDLRRNYRMSKYQIMNPENGVLVLIASQVFE
jgi:hypothetical protein